MIGTILVTGASGYLGAAVCRELASRHAVIGIYRHTSARQASLQAASVSLRVCDLRHSTEVAAMFSTCGPLSAIVHCAAVLPDGGRSDNEVLHYNNVMAEAVMTAATTISCPRIILCSSISVYENAASRSEKQALMPVSAYARAKLIAERQLADWAAEPGRCGIALRFAGIHGGDRHSGVVFALLLAALRGEPLSVTEPDSVFRLCFIDDAVQAVSRCLAPTLPTGFHCFNVASADSYRLRDLASAICRILPQAGPIQSRESAQLRDESMPITRLCDATGFRPMTLSAGLEASVAALLAEPR